MDIKKVAADIRANYRVCHNPLKPNGPYPPFINKRKTCVVCGGDPGNPR